MDVYMYIYVYVGLVFHEFDCRGSNCQSRDRLSEIGIWSSLKSSSSYLGASDPAFISPRGSKYPIFKDPGPQNHTITGCWDQSA